MQEYITIYDYLLLPLYLLIFYLIVRRKSNKYKAIGLQKTFLAAFWLRMAGAIFYSMLIQYYYGYGDSFGYYEGGIIIRDMIERDISSVKYLFLSAKDIVIAATAMGYEDLPVTMHNDSNVIVMKISALISFFTFNKYLLVAICFGFFSFLGIWKLFFVFYNLNNKKQVKLLAIFVLFFPSLWFWGSGLLKEPLCVGALGILIYYAANFKHKRRSVRNGIIILFMAFLLMIIKAYIIGLLLLSLTIVTVIFSIGSIKSKLLRIPVMLITLIFAYILYESLNVDTAIENFLFTAFQQIESLQSSYQAVQNEDERSKATFMMSQINPTLQGILLNTPAVIGTCLFRPFPWESQKVIIFISSLEAMLTLLVTLYVLVRLYFFKFFKYCFTYPVPFFCFIFSILFAALIGYTTFNFGTMIRYKVMFVPFYFFMFIYIHTKYKENKLIAQDK